MVFELITPHGALGTNSRAASLKWWWFGEIKLYLLYIGLNNEQRQIAQQIQCPSVLTMI
jgi:hypothetical protein